MSANVGVDRHAAALRREAYAHQHALVLARQAPPPSRPPPPPPRCVSLSNDLLGDTEPSLDDATRRRGSGIASVRSARGLDEKKVGLVLSTWAVLYALRHDE
jgi:hypothetical protein